MERQRHRSLRAVLLWLLLSVVAYADDIGKNASSQLKNFCRRFEHRTAVVNNKLFIDGGFVNANPLEQDGTNYTNALLSYSDLLVTDQGMPKMNSGPPKNTSVPSLAGGGLWADDLNSRFYAFGGYFPSSDPKPFETWTYDESRSSWSNVSTQGDVVSYVAHGMSAVAPDAGVGYYLGGYHDGHTQKGWATSRLYTPNLVEFDMIKRKYSNLTGPDGKGRGEGLMVFIPASTSGLLIYFGGLVQNQPSGEVSGVPMSEIWIFDISLEKWYVQNATGAIPDARTQFCGGAAWPDDKSSFNIYIYGGLRPNGVNINGTTGFDDLYILSIPAFVWIKMYSPLLGIGFPHHSTTCNIINGTQMVVMGGTFPESTLCDVPEVYAQHNVDLGKLNANKALWIGFSNTNPPYLLPSELTSVVGGTSKGGANATQPLNTSTSYDQYLFQKSYKVPQRYPTAVSDTTDAPSSEKQSPPSRSLLIGAIVGSVVGGVVLGIAAFGLLLFLRRRRQRRDSKGGLGVPQDSVIKEKMLDERDFPDELDGQNHVELPSKSGVELWAEPAELPGSNSSVAERK